MNNKARPSNKSNNMYTDRSGNVYQRDQKGNYQNKSNNRQGQQQKQQPSTNQQQRQAHRERHKTGNNLQSANNSRGSRNQVIRKEINKWNDLIKTGVQEHKTITGCNNKEVVAEAITGRAVEADQEGAGDVVVVAKGNFRFK